MVLFEGRGLLGVHNTAREAAKHTVSQELQAKRPKAVVRLLVFRPSSFAQTSLNLLASREL